ADAYWRLSRTEARLHHFREAIRCVDQAIAFSEKLRTNIFDDLQRVTYFATTQEMFDLAANLALKTGDAFLAFQYAEQARSRALLDAIDKATIKSLKARNVDLEQGTSLSLQTIRAKMPAAVQIVEYRITPDSLLLWLIDANSFVQKSIPVASVSLQKRVHDFLRSIGSEDLAALQARVRQDIKGVYDENRQLGKQLFQLIFKPIAGKIAAESAIIIIPDGVLYSLPFGALVTDDDLFFDQKYLWAKAPSVTVLTKNASLQADALETGQPKFLMVAGALPSSKNEKRQIKQYYKNAVVLEEESATYGNLNEKLRQGAHIAYFTVHSVADVRSPMNSFIELYDQQTANGRLKPTPIYARRLLDLDFSRTWLAVLNGCETAKGKITRGEGALNMVRIFSMANVPVVVASLWQNDDRRSAQIMGAFFKKIASGHLTPARALKEAKEQAVNLLRQEHEFPLPYFWAVFEVYENSWLN
ncbi:MAG: CHAT domain-containing protein, partial [bacterium]